MFANAEADVTPARVVAIEIAAAVDVVHCRSVQIGTATHEQRHRLRNGLQYFPSGFSRR